MPSLYELTEHLKLIDIQLEATEGECTDALYEYMLHIEESFEEKMEAYGCLVANKKALSRSLGDEIKRMRERKAVIDNTVSRLTTTLMDTLIEIDRPKVDAGKFSFSVSNAGGVRGLSVTDVSDEWMRVKYEPDTDKIRKALESGQVVAGAELKERGKVLRIR